MFRLISCNMNVLSNETIFDFKTLMRLDNSFGIIKNGFSRLDSIRILHPKKSHEQFTLGLYLSTFFNKTWLFHVKHSCITILQPDPELVGTINCPHQFIKKRKNTICSVKWNNPIKFSLLNLHTNSLFMKILFMQRNIIFAYLLFS